jgi:AMP-binding enzyme
MSWREKALAAPSRPAVFYRDRTISYGELLDRTTAAAKALLVIDVRAGDRIGALLGNDSDWVVMALAVGMIGATFVPLNTWYKRNELGWTIRHCSLSVIVVARRFLNTDHGRLFGELIPELEAAAPGRLVAPGLPSLRADLYRRDAARRPRMVRVLERWGVGDIILARGGADKSGSVDDRLRALCVEKHGGTKGRHADPPRRSRERLRSRPEARHRRRRPGLARYAAVLCAWRDQRHAGGFDGGGGARSSRVVRNRRSHRRDQPSTTPPARSRAQSSNIPIKRNAALVR